MAIDCIGIDIGYGFTKTCRSEKDRQIFPTAVAMMTKEGAFEETIPVVGQRPQVPGRERRGEGRWQYDTRRSSFVASDAWLADPGPLPLAQRLPQTATSCWAFLPECTRKTITGRSSTP